MPPLSSPDQNQDCCRNVRVSVSSLAPECYPVISTLAHQKSQLVSQRLVSVLEPNVENSIILANISFWTP